MNKKFVYQVGNNKKVNFFSAGAKLPKKKIVETYFASRSTANQIR